MSWYYAQQGQRIGPVAADELLRLAEAGRIPPETLVWREGMGDWQPWQLVIATAFPGRSLCHACGKLASADDLVAIQGVQVCAACKPLHLQRVREGILPLGGQGGLSPTFGSGKRIVMALKQPLPPRCVCCNAAATTTKRHTFYWYPPWIYILLLVGPLILVIVGLIVKRKAAIEIPLCDDHHQRRKKNVLICWAWGLSSVGMLILGVFLLNNNQGETGGFLMLAGAISFIAALIVGQRVSSILSVHHIGKETITLTRASPEFIGSLPPWPGGPTT